MDCFLGSAYRGRELFPLKTVQGKLNDIHHHKYLHPTFWLSISSKSLSLMGRKSQLQHLIVFSSLNFCNMKCSSSYQQFFHNHYSIFQKHFLLFIFRFNKLFMLERAKVFGAIISILTFSKSVC